MGVVFLGERGKRKEDESGRDGGRDLLYLEVEEERRTHNSWKPERKGPHELEKRKAHKSWRDEDEVDVSASVCQLVRTS